MILDYRGQPIKPPSAPPKDSITVASVRDRWSTYPSAGLTPQRLAQIFREADQGDVLRQAELFEEMEEKDAHLFSQLQTRKLAINGLGWEVLPQSEDDARAQQVADFVSEALLSVDLDDLILDLMDAVAKGFSVVKLNWMADAGRTWIGSHEWVHSKKITFFDSMQPRILTDANQSTGEELPPWAFVYHRYKARSGYDTRAGVLRVCGWMYLFKNYAIKDWVAFAEVFGQPLRLGKYEPGASTDDRDSLLAAVRNLGTDAAGIISKTTEIEFVEAAKTSSINLFEALTSFCDQQMSKAITGQTLSSDSGQGGSGSYALGKVHADVRHDLLEADAIAISRTIQRQVILPLVGFNFGWDAPMPIFRISYQSPEDLAYTSSVYKALVEMGFDVSQEHISERFNIPMAAEDETPLAPAAASNPFEQMPLKRRAKKTPLKNGKREEGFGDVLDIEDQATAAAEDIMGRILQPIMERIGKAASLSEIGEGIISQYPDIETDELQEMIARAMFMAGAEGYGTAQEEAE